MRPLSAVERLGLRRALGVVFAARPELRTKTKRALTAVGLMALTTVGCAVAARFLPITNHIVLITAALSPYLMLGAPVALVLLVVARRRILGVVAAALTVATFAMHLPAFLGSATARPETVTLRVMSANVREGHADADDLVRSARETADIVALQELTEDAIGRLSAAGLDSTFPYRWVDPGAKSDGTGVWSRYPLHATGPVEGFTMPALGGRLRVPGVSPDPTVRVVHVSGPWPQSIDAWRRDIDRLSVTLAETAQSTGSSCVIVAGDFNSTMDMRPFRALLRDGYRDAGEHSDAGFTPTFPANSRLPPLITIDHILTRNCPANSLHTVSIPGSDHRGIVANVLIPM